MWSLSKSMYLIELFQPCKRTISPGPSALITPHAITAPPPPCKVDTDQLGKNLPYFLRWTYRILSVSTLLNLLSSLKNAFNQYETLYSSLQTGKSIITLYICLRDAIHFRLTIQHCKENSFNLIFIVVTKRNLFQQFYTVSEYDESFLLFLNRQSSRLLISFRISDNFSIGKVKFNLFYIT